ncbi:MAG: SDR family oxidoreductase [Candidatus Pelagadaptatus aseana]|uniref:SDR family NAD(P)-dependent oxidoreductase n=1 Tax=Candidatus Pelagadaptatus aseana TaxID=3120508 RepID=UPI0039B24AB0
MSKTVFITGASSGLGKGMAEEFARRGYNLALAARRSLEELAQDLQNRFGVRAVAYALDVSDADAVKGCLEQVKSDFDQIDIVIANAGIGVTMAIGKGDFSEAQKTVDTNITGLMATVEFALPILREQGFGQIVGISSVAGLRGMPSIGVYSGTKSFVTSYLQTLQVEAWRENIDVTILAPGYIDTPINQGAKSRPFVIPLEKGVVEMVDKIEKKVSYSFVPGWPWHVVGRIIKILPNRFFAK